jgi:nitroimidazol reductase NimA-like FMN-containing flavoprotein (pyridoxamine 5'-phosphate oxidase superfamily)
MLIHEMTEGECRTALSEMDFGRLACARDDQPYVVPVNFACDGTHLYGLTTFGQKIEWMRSNPLVCLEADERTYHDRWVSVVVFGRYEELPDTPDHQRARAHALKILQNRTMWWEPASIPTERREQRPPIFYRISIGKVTGRRAMPDSIKVADEEALL